MNAIIVSGGKVLDDMVELFVPLVCFLLHGTLYSPGGEVKTQTPYFSDSLCSHPHRSFFLCSLLQIIQGLVDGSRSRFLGTTSTSKNMPCRSQHCSLLFVSCAVHCSMIGVTRGQRWPNLPSLLFSLVCLSQLNWPLQSSLLTSTTSPALR